jgi:hypothetical protein
MMKVVEKAELKAFVYDTLIPHDYEIDVFEEDGDIIISVYSDDYEVVHHLQKYLKDKYGFNYELINSESYWFELKQCD